MSSAPANNRFADNLLAWFDQNGRNHLPWQSDRKPYRVWVSEIMLQQTQVRTVIDYYQRFMQHFPDLASLAGAELDQLMLLWEGLGYYSRARNLHATAKLCVQQHGGELPDNIDQLCDLPGIGRSTAGAIVSLALDRPAPILDGNVKRVLTRYHALPGWPGGSAVARQLWQLAETHLPAARAADYSQACMDLGALVCRPKAPACNSCPLNEDCIAHKQGTQDKFPEKKKPTPVPQRHCVLIMMIDQQGCLLLEKRPPSGIWGGLWSLPMFDSLEQAESSLGQLQSKRFAVPFTHVFTHFRLQARPLAAQFKAANTGIREGPGERWINSSQANTLGMPKPIRILVSDYFSGQTQWQEQSTV